MTIRILISAACVGALVVPATSLAELPKAEQICINKMNKDGIKVQAAQLKVNDGCVKDEVKTGSDGDFCMDDDAKMKVAKKRAKTENDQIKKCDANVPGVFYTGANVTNDAAEDSAKALHRDVFGAGLSSLLSCDTHDDECLCQRKVINRVTKLERAIGKIWLKCKKAAMKDGKDPFSNGGAETEAELEQCATNAALAGDLSVATDQKGKIMKAEQQLSDTAGQFCAVNSSVDEFATGECSGFSTPPTIDEAGLAACLRDLAECRFCEMINATDGLAIDCDAFSGSTCP